MITIELYLKLETFLESLYASFTQSGSNSVVMIKLKREDPRKCKKICAKNRTVEYANCTCNKCVPTQCIHVDFWKTL